MSTVLIVGGGDMADRLAHGLAASGRVRKLVFASVSRRVDLAAAALASSYDVTVSVDVLDARNRNDVAALLRRVKPDLIVQSAALMSPWALGGRTDAFGTALASAGLGLRLPLQIPVLRATMEAVREVGYSGPVANLSFPDVTHPLLHRLGLAPTVGLGNVAMYMFRARAALRAELGPDAPMPLIRAAGQHGTVYNVMNAEPFRDGRAGPWIWVGEGGERRDALAYTGLPVPPSVVFNAVTAASSLPILLALLPGAEPLRWSVPGPLGLMGGYPVRIADGAVSLDLPVDVALPDCERMCTAAASGDGIERVADGVVYYTDAAQAAMARVASELAEPFTIEQADHRANRILELLNN